MEANHVAGVERCRGQALYPSDNRRAMIAMEPVMDDSVASIMELDEILRPTAVQCIIRTLVQMLSAGVVTTDVQPLMSKATGEVLFIDMTEAKIVFTDTSRSSNDSSEIPFVDMALASSFVSEMLGLIPADSSDAQFQVANKQLMHELHKIRQEMKHVSDTDSASSNINKDTRMTHIRSQQRQLLELLRNQASFMSQDCIDYIDKSLYI